VGSREGTVAAFPSKTPRGHFNLLTSPALPPSLPSLVLSTAELGPLEGILFGKRESAFHRTNRKRLFRSWGSLTAMLPKGGNDLWGNLTHAPEDVEWEVDEVGGGEGGGDATVEQEGCLPYLESETGTFVKDGIEGEERGREGEGDWNLVAAKSAVGAAAGAAADAITRKGGEEACVTPAEVRRQPVHHGQTFGFTPPTPLAAAAAAIAPAVPPSTPPPSKSASGSVDEDHQIATTAEAAASSAAASAAATKLERDEEAAAAVAASVPPWNKTTEGGMEGGPGQGRANWTMEDVIHYLSTDPEDAFLRRRMTEDYSFGPPVKDFRKERHVKEDRKYWTNPLTVQLPQAPSMRIVCFYGVGKATERAYIYRGDREGRPDVIDISVSDARRNISGGVVKAEGDGTVTLVSLGFHCARLWREKVHNPAGIGVTTKELWHTTAGLLSMRGDGGSADHVDIMGNTKMAADLLKVVSGMDEEEVYGQDVYFSRIREISEKVPL